MRNFSAFRCFTPSSRILITAVPDPEATLDEFARVVKPGGEIILVNHIGAKQATPVSKKAFPRLPPPRLAARVSHGNG